jgi:hypothetical protein
VAVAVEKALEMETAVVVAVLVVCVLLLRLLAAVVL